MDNILYLDDYINLYNKKNHQLIIGKPYKNTLRNGFVVDREKFIKKYKSLLEEYGLKESFFSETILIVINNLFTKEDKKNIKEIMEELNYKNIQYIQEVDYLKINKNTIYINCNYNYFYIIHTNYLGDIEVNLYKNDNINKSVFINIINYLKKDKIILYGKNYQEFINILSKEKVDYYYYEEYENLIIQILLNNKKV